MQEEAAEVVGMAAEVVGMAVAATGEAGFMPHSVEVMGLLAGATAVVVFMARSEDFIDPALTLGVRVMAFLRIVGARCI